MNTQQHDAYTVHQRSDETIRETEAHALLSCASKIEDARNEEVPRTTYTAALRHNQRLWTVFQVALCEPDNELPKDLKIVLLNLSRYVDKVTFRALQEKNRNIAHSLININRTLAKGLRKKADKEEKAEAEARAQEQKQDQNAAPPKPLSTSV